MSERDKGLVYQQNGTISFTASNGDRFTVGILHMEGGNLNLGPNECIVLYGNEGKVMVERRLKRPVLHGEVLAHAARDLIDDHWPHALLTLTAPDPTATPSAILAANLVIATRDALGIKAPPPPKSDEAL
jgi:hypothetical protein